MRPGSYAEMNYNSPTNNIQSSLTTFFSNKHRKLTLNTEFSSMKKSLLSTKEPDSVI